MTQPTTANEIIVEMLHILQRQLPGGDLSPREAIAELWGLAESPAVEQILTQAKPDDHPR